jgi:hypothetical protein
MYGDGPLLKQIPILRYALSAAGQAVGGEQRPEPNEPKMRILFNGLALPACLFGRSSDG